MKCVRADVWRLDRTLQLPLELMIMLQAQTNDFQRQRVRHLVQHSCQWVQLFRNYRHFRDNKTTWTKMTITPKVKMTPKYFWQKMTIISKVKMTKISDKRWQSFQKCRWHKISAKNDNHLKKWRWHKQFLTKEDNHFKSEDDTKNFHQNTQNS